MAAVASLEKSTLEIIRLPATENAVPPLFCAFRGVGAEITRSKEAKLKIESLEDETSRLQSRFRVGWNSSIR